jgi:hypothetical protein
MPIALISENDPRYDDQTFSNYPSLPTREQLEAAIKMERLDLYNHVKPYGPKALRQHLQSLGIINLPSERTIGRKLKKHGLINESDKNYQ